MQILASLILFFLAVIIHECAHGWVALKLGDPTAKHSGRLTLNPLAHIDPVGTIILPLFLAISGSPFLFGWAKPVPVNFSGLNNPKKDMMWVGLAGPAANILLAIIVSLFIKLEITILPLQYLETFLIVNLVLAVFNLMPIPPLDGSRVLVGLLPPKAAFQYLKLERFGFLIIFGLLFLGIFDYFVWPIVIIVLKILLS
ncbi:site-2 protease family protein [Thermoproteota archaeon]